jgi:hypothetical protein
MANGMNGFFDSVSVGTRRFDPVLAKRARANINAQGRGIGIGTANQIGTGLLNRGLGNSAGIYGAAGAGGRAQGDFLSKYLLNFDLGEQDFTENARRFDTGTALALKQMFLQRKRDEEAQPGWLDVLGSMIGGGAQVGAARLGRG